MSFKKVYDPIHRFIHLDEIETQFIQTKPFARLRYIHQLGPAFYVYPGGTHSRYEHSLGVLEIATRIYDHITSAQGGASHFVPDKGSDAFRYFRKIVRLAALAHDLGHLPLSHTAEKRILKDKTHEAWTKKIIFSDELKPIWQKIEAEFPDRNVARDVATAALGEKKYLELSDDKTPFTPWERIVSDIITADFFGADRIDYLLRDTHYTGLSYSMFDFYHLLETLRIIPCEKGSELGIEENGIESAEALLLSRYFVHKRLCQYGSVKAYCFHMGRFIEKLYGEFLEKATVEQYISLKDPDIITSIDAISKDPSHPAYIDAAVFTHKETRFAAIPLGLGFDEEICKQFSKIHSIPEQEIGWDLMLKSKKKIGLSFPVIRKDGSIVRGEELSELSIPEHSQSWLFLHPKHLLAHPSPEKNLLSLYGRPPE